MRRKKILIAGRACRGCGERPGFCKCKRAPTPDATGKILLTKEREDCVRLPNDTKIRFCNAMDALRAHSCNGGCTRCTVYIQHGDGDMCATGKDIIARELAYADTGIEFPQSTMSADTKGTSA